MSNYKTTNFSEIKTVLNLKENGEKLISTEDSYLENFSKFDLESRCHKHNATLEDFISLCRSSVKDFTGEEIDSLTEIFFEVDNELKRRGMVLPAIEEINFVRTSGAEENNTPAYTRGNTIYLCDGAFINEGFLEHLIVHELFHILTRNCLEFKKQMYSVIGFKVEDRTFEYPESIAGNFVSNPDTPNQLCYARFTIGFHSYGVVPMCYTHFDWDESSSFFERLVPYFFAIDNNKNFIRKEDGQLLKFNLHQASDAYLEHIGRNTGYIIHPEEALAENFCYAVLGYLDDLPNEKIVFSIREAMQTA